MDRTSRGNNHSRHHSLYLKSKIIEGVGVVVVENLNVGIGGIPLV